MHRQYNRSVGSTAPHRGAANAVRSLTSASSARERCKAGPGRRAHGGPPLNEGGRVYPSNVATAHSVNLSGSDSPALASSKILRATSSITGVEPVSSKRAHACLNAQFIASRRRCSSSTVESPTQPALSGYYRRPNCCECELPHIRWRCTQKNPSRRPRWFALAGKGRCVPPGVTGTSRGGAVAVARDSTSH
jgi:hypothetical protein